MGINEIKSKITDKTKVIFGVIVLIFGLLLLGLLGVKFILSVILIALPAILLLIPNDNIKNSRIIGIILIIWLIINLLGYLIGVIDPYSYFESNYDFMTAGYEFSGNGMNYFSEIDMLQSYAFFSCIIMSIYTIINIFGALLFFVPTHRENNLNVKMSNISKSFTCPNCGENIKKESKFCPNCGENLEDKKRTCPDCGEIVEDDNKFCHNCGKVLADEIKTCPDCGETLHDNDDFCSNCGKKVE